MQARRSRDPWMRRWVTPLAVSQRCITTMTNCCQGKREKQVAVSKPGPSRGEPRANGRYPTLSAVPRTHLGDSPRPPPSHSGASTIKLAATATTDRTTTSSLYLSPCDGSDGNARIQDIQLWWTISQPPRSPPTHSQAGLHPSGTTPLGVFSTAPDSPDTSPSFCGDLKNILLFREFSDVSSKSRSVKEHLHRQPPSPLTSMSSTLPRTPDTDRRT